MLKSKNVIITGCNKGIGKSILEVFAKNHANIWACTRKEYSDFSKEIKILEKEYGIWIKNINFDLSNDEQVKEAAKKISNESKNIDILVNNAGIIDTSLFQMTKIEDIKNLFNINFFSQLLFSQIIIKKMIRNKSGNIINISSTSAMDSNIGRLAYSASKSSLLIASQILSKELSSFNIRVNVVAPGLTDTDLMKNSHSESIINDTINRVSLKRIANPDEIAKTVLFLASDSSSYINGQTIRVDGGLS